MHQRNGRLKALVAQVGEIVHDLVGDQHALIDDGPGREAGRIKEVSIGDFATVANLVFSALADDVELALKGQRVVALHLAAADENLALKRLAQLGGVAQGGVVGGHVPPAEQALALFFDDAGEALLANLALDGVGRQKQHAYSVLARRGQLKVADATKELVGQLHQHAGTIARVGLATAGTSVLEMFQDLQGLAHHLVRLVALDVYDKANPAGVAFAGGVVKALLLRVSVGHFNFPCSIF